MATAIAIIASLILAAAAVSKQARVIVRLASIAWKKERKLVEIDLLVNGSCIFLWVESR